MDENWEWFSGIFESEGWCSTSGGHRGTNNWRGYPTLGLNMNDKDIVEKFVNIAGYGNMNFSHTPAHQKAGSSPQWRWAISRQSEVIRITKNMTPYLFSRRLARLREFDLVNSEIEETSRGWPWASGLFEGEGMIMWSNKKTTWTLRLNMTDEDVVNEFASIVGYGKVVNFHPPSHKNRGWQPTYSWSASKKSEVIRICSELYPYLGERRKEKIKELEII